MLYITGITGHSGKWLFRRLEEENYSGTIRCAMRESRIDAPEKYELFENSKLDLEFAVGDLRDETFLSDSLGDVDTLIHIAGINLSTKIVDAAIANGVKWVILVHTTGRFSKFKSASSGYIQIEDDILARCSADAEGVRIMNCTVLRPTMIYGSSGDRNMYRLVGYLDKHKVFPLFGAGSNLMQPVHARDLGNAYYQVLTHPKVAMNKCYDLSGRDPITYLEIIKTIRRLLGSRILIVKLPIGFSILAAKVYNKLFKKAVISVEQVMRMQEDKAFSHEDADRDFGYAPMSFEQGIREEIEEYKRGVRVDFSRISYK